MNEELDAPVEEVIEPSLQEGETTTEATDDSSPSEEIDATQRRFNQITAEKYANKRAADAAEAKVQELEAKLEAANSKTAPIGDAPKPPQDEYDEEAKAEYQRQLQAHNQKLINDQVANAIQAERGNQEKAQAQAAQSAQINKFAENAIRDGVDVDSLRNAEQTLLNAGISPQLGQHLVADVNGGKITEYLANNPEHMQEVLGLSPMDAAVVIANKIKPLALKSTPRVSNAAEPIPEVSGGGVVEKDDFDRNFPDSVII